MLVLTAQDLADPYLETIGDRLMVAAACHVLVPSVGLDRAFWTAPDALWEGEIAAGLTQLAYDFQRPLPGFLCMHASAAGPWGLAWQRSSPLRAAGQLSGDFATGGPYLVLLRCECDWTGKVSICGGFAQPVFHRTLPFPVTCPLERDIVTVLLKIQDLGEAAGRSLKIVRNLQAGALSPLAIVSAEDAGDRLIGAITCAAPAPPAPSCRAHKAAGTARYTTRQCLADGSFQNWLESLEW